MNSLLQKSSYLINEVHNFSEFLPSRQQPVLISTDADAKESLCAGGKKWFLSLFEVSRVKLG